MRKSHIILGLSAVVTATHVGCFNKRATSRFHANAVTTKVSVPQIVPSDAMENGHMPYYAEASSPLDLDEQSLTADRFRAMTLQECINEALQSSRIMRDLGATVLRSPQTITTNLDPALMFSDPRLGEEAALSAFDANFFASTNYDSNDRRYNNRFFGNNDGLLRQHLSTSQVGVNKRSATGGLYTIRNVSVYDRNNQISNSIGTFSWESFVEAEARQPLLQGAGTQFNRIAGPGALPGQLNGVLLARVRTDISLIDFERGVRDFVSEVENAYWDLYYAYRDLDAKIQARNIARETVQSLAEVDTSSGKFAQAEEQYLRFQSDVVDSLNGRAIDGTRTNNGSTGGSFRGTGGVRVCERKLRLLIGLPINDGMLLSPSDRPLTGLVTFDWNSILQEALSHREELRRQRWVIKQRELELIANRNFLKPQLEGVAAYRMRGFGKTLVSPLEGDFQEWTLGLDYQLPVGFRRANASVKNSQLALARESAVLLEQERAVHLGLSNAINEAKRAFENAELQRQRLDKIVLQLDAFDAANDVGDRPELDVRLETHRRLLDARLRYYQSEVEYALALRNVHVEKGTLLHYCNVSLSEAGPTAEVAEHASKRIASQDPSKIPESRDIIVGRTR